MAVPAKRVSSFTTRGEKDMASKVRKKILLLTMLLGTAIMRSTVVNAATVGAEKEVLISYQTATEMFPIFGTATVHIQADETINILSSGYQYPNRSFYYWVRYNGALQYKSVTLSMNYHFTISSGSSRHFSGWQSESTFLPQCDMGGLYSNYTSVTYSSPSQYLGKASVNFYDNTLWNMSNVVVAEYNLY